MSGNEEEDAHNVQQQDEAPGAILPAEVQPQVAQAPVVPQVVQVNIPLPAQLDAKGNLSIDWKKFRRVWDNYEIASRLKNENKELRTATLLTCIGPDALEIYDGLAFSSEAEKTDIDVVLQKLGAYYVGVTNEIYERYNFNRRVQEESESVDSFVAALRTLAKTCNYGTLTDTLIRDRMVVGVRDNSLRKKITPNK